MAGDICSLIFALVLSALGVIFPWYRQHHPQLDRPSAMTSVQRLLKPRPRRLSGVPAPVRPAAHRTGTASSSVAFSTCPLAFEGDPPYQVGETYVLFAEPKLDEIGTYLLISPEGRYRVVNDTLEPMAEEGFAAAMRGKRVADLVQALAQTAAQK